MEKRKKRSITSAAKRMRNYRQHQYNITHKNESDVDLDILMVNTHNSKGIVNDKNDDNIHLNDDNDSAGDDDDDS